MVKKISNSLKGAFTNLIIWIIFSMILLKSLGGGDGLGTVALFLVLGISIIPVWLLGLFAGWIAKKRGWGYWAILGLDIIFMIIYVFLSIAFFNY